MKKIKKRGAVYGVIALLLCAAAYLNWSYVDTPEDLLAAQQTDVQADTQTDASADSTAGEDDYFASSRLTRTQARDKAITARPVSLRTLLRLSQHCRPRKPRVSAVCIPA